MPTRQTKHEVGEILTIHLGDGGVDYFTDPTRLAPDALARAENCDASMGTMDRRKGAVKVAQLSAPSACGKSRLFGTIGKYMKISAANQLKIPYGGFALMFHVVATRAAGVGYVLSTNTDVASQPILVRLQADGTLTVAVTWSDASQSVITTAALTNGSVQHGLLVFDAVAGTLTLYLNGAVTGTPVTGLSATKRPVQTAVDWYVGVTFGSATFSAPFAGTVDSLTLFTLRGLRASQGTSFVETLRRHSGRTWPNPAQDFVLFHYDLDEASGSVAYDRSNYKNHGLYVGASTVSDPIAMLSAPCNFIGRVDVPEFSGNLVGSFGALYYETTRGVA